MDSYQPIYDAVRSKISGGSVADAISDAIRNANLGHYAMVVAQDISSAAFEHMRPSAVYRPSMWFDGVLWCALYGEDRVNGVAGFGESPAEAMLDFDKAWTAKITK